MSNLPIPQQECDELFEDLLNIIDGNSNTGSGGPGASHPELQTLIRQLDADRPMPALSGAEAAAVLASSSSSSEPAPAPPLPPPPQQQTNSSTTATTTTTPQRPINLPNHSRECRRQFQHLNDEPPQRIDYGFPDGQRGLCAWQWQLLAQQQRQHVQLAAQSWLQVYGHPYSNWWRFADAFRSMLADLAEQHDDAAEAEEDDGADGLRIANLRPALRLLDEYEAARSVHNAANVRFVRFFERHAELSVRTLELHHQYFFHPFVQRAMLESRGVFLYAHLLPEMPFRLDRRGSAFRFLSSEDL